MTQQKQIWFLKNVMKKWLPLKTFWKGSAYACVLDRERGNRVDQLKISRVLLSAKRRNDNLSTIIKLIRIHDHFSSDALILIRCNSQSSGVAFEMRSLSLSVTHQDPWMTSLLADLVFCFCHRHHLGRRQSTGKTSVMNTIFIDDKEHLARKLCRVIVRHSTVRPDRCIFDNDLTQQKCQQRAT